MVNLNFHSSQYKSGKIKSAEVFAKNFQGSVCNVPKLKIKNYGNYELQFFSASLMTSFNQTSGKFFKGNVIPSAD